MCKNGFSCWLSLERRERWHNYTLFCSLVLSFFEDKAFTDSASFITLLKINNGEVKLNSMTSARWIVTGLWKESLSLCKAELEGIRRRRAGNYSMFLSLKMSLVAFRVPRCPALIPLLYWAPCVEVAVVVDYNIVRHDADGVTLRLPLRWSCAGVH
jgi:hypothetical protein